MKNPLHPFICIHLNSAELVTLNLFMPLLLLGSIYSAAEIHKNSKVSQAELISEICTAFGLTVIDIVECNKLCSR